MTEDELAQAQIDLDRWAASQAAGYTPSEKAAMQAFIAKNAKKWALPTTGNLAYDDYRRSSEAFGKAARGAITGYTPTVTTGEGTEYYQEIAGSPIYGASVGNPDLYFQDWLGSMSPQQQAEYESLQDAHSDKIKGRMRLGALAAFGGIAGAGMFGAGMLGSGALGGGGGIGALGGAEGLAAADIAGGLIPAFGTDAAYMAGLGTYAMPVSAGSAIFSDLGGLGGMAELFPEFASPMLTSEGVAGAGAAAGGTGLGGGGGAASIPGLDNYYSGLGGVDGSLVGSGVTNNTGAAGGFANWFKGLSPDLITKLAGAAGGMDSLLKGLYGLYQSNKFSELGKGTPAQQTANSQLDALLKNPDQIYNMPGWKAGLQAVERTGAGQGYLGSGNMMIALNDYGGNFYNNTVRQLNDIATGGQSAQLAYREAGADLFGQGANSIGYWMAKWGKPIADMIGGP